MEGSIHMRKVSAFGMLTAVLLPLVGCATTGINQGQVNIVSSDEEVKLGQEMSVEVARQYPIYDNAAVTAYVQAVGDRIAQNSDRKDIPYHFAVINQKTVNAFSLPGGYVYAYTELMKAADDEAEFAAVIAHEVAHVAARHATERLTQQYGYQFLSDLVFGKNPNAAVKLVTDLAATGGFLKYGRDDEYEADRLGAKYLHAAGYDPQAMVDFLDKLKALETSEPSKLETWLMTHPPASDRVARVRTEVAGFPKLANPVRNAAAYAGIKAQLPK
jgi:beta-barrel assembly-enhancing protease